MALFKRPADYSNGEEGGGGTAVMEAEPPVRSPDPFEAELQALAADAEELARLLKEGVELDRAAQQAEVAAQALAQKLEEMKTPKGLAEHTDAEVRESADALTQAQRTLGANQLAVERHRSDHGDLQQRRERLGERRQRLERQHAEWKLIEDFFEIAADLESALSRLALWTGRRTALNRSEGIVLQGLTEVDDFPGGGPLTEGLVHRNFKFLRCLFNREQVDSHDPGMAKSLGLVREKGIWPSRLFMGWR